MAFYEHVLIARPDVSTQQIEALMEDLSRVIEENGGKIVKNEYWGLRNLAYRVRKNRKGHYALLNIEAPAIAVQELDRKQRINEDVIRFLTVRVESHDADPSPVLARRERDEKRRAARTDGPREGGFRDGPRDGPRQ
jgi:small subunit ribosomal protein S6